MGEEWRWDRLAIESGEIDDFLFTQSGGGIASRHAGHSSDTREA
jgi:hypothetical protein